MWMINISCAVFRTTLHIPVRHLPTLTQTLSPVAPNTRNTKILHHLYQTEEAERMETHSLWPHCQV